MSKRNRTRIRWRGNITLEESERWLDHIDRSNRSGLPRKSKRALRKAWEEYQQHSDTPNR
jgi:hypothetical protein